MNAEKVLSEIKQRGMKIWPHLEMLRFAPPELMPEFLFKEMVENKQMILKKLRAKLGVGGEMKRILRTFGIEEKSTCKCNARSATMDLWGPDQCEQRADEIVGWLREEAKKRKLPFLDVVGRMILKRAIKAARKT